MGAWPLNFGDLFSNPASIWLIVAMGLATASVALVLIALFMMIRIRRESKRDNLLR